MVALAEHDGTGWLSVPRISTAMHIPERILPRVMGDLARAGLVEGRPGRAGGYRLARPAATITLLDVISAVEPEPDARACIMRGGSCGIDGGCAVHQVFADARAAMLERLATVPLDRLAGSPRA
jgi:Rrf2 family protein